MRTGEHPWPYVVAYNSVPPNPPGKPAVPRWEEPRFLKPATPRTLDAYRVWRREWDLSPGALVILHIPQAGVEAQRWPETGALLLRGAACNGKWHGRGDPPVFVDAGNLHCIRFWRPTLGRDWSLRVDVVDQRGVVVDDWQRELDR